MMSARRAEERAGAILAYLPEAAAVIDVGCGPGTITAGLASPSTTVLGVDANAAQLVAHPGVWFVAATATELPCPDGSFDVYFSHALFEHLPDPAAALAEAHRVLRPGGRLAIVASDWSRARFDPHTPDVDTALRGHRLLRRRTGADPDAGGRLPEWIATAGFAVDEVHHHHRVDLTYAGLAAYIASRLTDPEGVAAARRWQRTSGTWTQCWTEVVAHAVGCPRTA
jgi:SAM-dependent methyltransferase